MKDNTINVLAPVDMSEKISVVVPVYNAEMFLGHCLNSLVSQSYVNWETILVNDGSTDNSLKICENYAAIDSRFKVISVPNGGVSKARNIGLEHATGKYLHFVDSDDMLAMETLEREISAARTYGAELVVHDVLLVDFTNPQKQGPRLNASWLKNKPAVLDSAEFKKYRMQLILHTALLEGPCAKLYNRELWEKLNLRFPTKLSLGEDFVTNMKYYAACNGIVFLQQIGYYYNNVDNSDSLTHKYRPDLFENKMYLMDKLEEHLGGRENLSSEELDAFYCYIANTGFRCIEDMVMASGLSKKEMNARLRVMLNNQLFAESIESGCYIFERFVDCIPYIKQNRMESVVDHMKGQKNTNTQENGPGFVNRAIRKIMRTVRPMFGEGVWGDRLERWEQEIATGGLKHTFSAHKMAKKRINRFMLEQHKDELKTALDDASRTILGNIDHKIIDVEKRMDCISNDLLACINDQKSELQETIVYEAAAIARAVNDYTWISEQRMSRIRYLAEINELRQKKKAVMIATAEHANIGDAAITLAEQYILQEQFSEYYQIEISTYEYAQKEAFLHAIINPTDIIFVNGGGNMGDKYAAEEDLHCRIVEDFPNNKIIVFPQTISFSDTETGRSVLERSAYIYNHHPDLTLFVRGETSLAFAKEHFSNVKTILMPDVVHVLRTNYALKREGVLLCLREDQEGWLNQETKDRIYTSAQNVAEDVEWCTNIAETDVTRDIRGFVVRRELKRFAARNVVVTDRLHGMIFAAITNTPCVVISSYNHKIKEYYDAFFADSNAVFFIGNELEKLDATLEQAFAVTEPVYPVLDRKLHGELRKLCEA